MQKPLQLQKPTLLKLHVSQYSPACTASIYMYSMSTTLNGFLSYFPAYCEWRNSSNPSLNLIDPATMTNVYHKAVNKVLVCLVTHIFFADN